MVYNWRTIVQEWLLPSYCLLCGQAGEDQLDLCRACRNDLFLLKNTCERCALPLQGNHASGICGACLKRPPHYDSAFSLYHYQQPASHLIHGLKFGGHLRNARLLGTLLARELLAQSVEMPEAILPVPLHARRLRERGFNQSIELARPASRALGLPLGRDLVTRSRPTSPQTALDIKQRRQNLRNAFVVAGKIPYSHIAILDDVVTTGSTVNELAKVLRRSGVQTIQVWSIARAV